MFQRLKASLIILCTLQLLISFPYSSRSYIHEYLRVSFLNTLSANPTKWSNTLKQFLGKSRQFFYCVWQFREVGAWRVKESIHTIGKDLLHYFSVLRLIRTIDFNEFENHVILLTVFLDLKLSTTCVIMTLLAFLKLIWKWFKTHVKYFSLSFIAYFVVYDFILLHFRGPISY